MKPQIQYKLFQEQAESRALQPDVRIVNHLVTDHQPWFDFLNTTVHWKTGFKSRQYATFGISYNDKTGLKKNGAMPQWLEPLCQSVQQQFGFMPNNCLINSYPDGNHYISYHSDQQIEMQAQTGVAIISLGAVRQMSLRRIDNHSICFHYALPPGSGLFMQDALQSEWQHGVLKQAGCGHRISLSFRCLMT